MSVHAAKSPWSFKPPYLQRISRAFLSRVSFQIIGCFTNWVPPFASILSRSSTSSLKADEPSSVPIVFVTIIHHCCQLQPIRDQPHFECGPLGKMLKAISPH